MNCGELFFNAAVVSVLFRGDRKGESLNMTEAPLFKYVKGHAHVSQRCGPSEH